MVFDVIPTIILRGARSWFILKNALRWILAVCAALLNSAALNAQRLPVKPVTRSFDIDLASGLAVVDLPIVSEKDSLLYILHCRGGTERELDELGSRDGINWVGPLMCVFNEANSKMSENSLLAEDDSPPWHTRGQFCTNELIGACGAYPEFGTERSFRLRGFVLHLSAQNLKLNSDGALQGLTLAVSVRQDPAAKGAQAERPEYLRPTPRKCETVRKGRDPRMCRVWTGANAGSYAPCPE
jgi:hypothetical protein